MNVRSPGKTILLPFYWYCQSSFFS